MSFEELLERLNEEEDYHGEHRAPIRQDVAAGGGSPLHDLSDTYPDDIYGGDGARLYGHNTAADHEAIEVFRRVRGNPKARVKIYRAVPKTLNRDEKIWDLEAKMKATMRRGRVPAEYQDDFSSSSKYYEWLSDELEKQKSLPDSGPAEKLSIEPGNWVTVSKSYAKEHGRSNLGAGGFRILSKTVYAGELFTEGNSLHEQGYDPF